MDRPRTRLSRPVFALVLLTVLASTSCSDDSQAKEARSAIDAGAAPLLQLVDSTVLDEPDSALLARPVDLALDRGSFFVSDLSSRRVHRYARDGGLTATYGRSGRGPGEFEAPFRSAVTSDGLLAVVDRSQQRVSLFDVESTQPRGEVMQEGLAYSINSFGRGLLLGSVVARTWSPLGVWSPGMDSVRPAGSMPRPLLTSAMLPSMRMAVSAIPLSAGAAVLFSNVDSIFLFDSTGRIIRKVAVPALRRRGVPADAEVRGQMSRSAPEAYAILSTAAELGQLTSGAFAAVHFDFTLVGQRLTAVGWVTLVSADGSQSCSDATLPLSQDGMPNVAFHGDTLFVLDQFVTASGVRSVVRAWKVSAEGCGWSSSSKLTGDSVPQ